MSTGLDRTLELLEKLIKSKKNLSDRLVAKGEEASFNEPFDSLTQKAADYVPKTYIFTDENGNEFLGTLVSQETIFDATENDVRAGKTFASYFGAKTGTKLIPSYVTQEGYAFVTANSQFVIKMLEELHDYTKLQVLICPYNASIAKSVATEKVVINDGVYAVNSTELLATVTKDSENQHINLGITNDSGNLYLMRYFTYKEIY